MTFQDFPGGVGTLFFPEITTKVMNGLDANSIHTVDATQLDS